MAYRRNKILYSTWEPEKVLYESIGLTRDQYIINEFEEKTGIKFDPERYEIAFEKGAKDDGYDNPIVPIVVVEKSKKSSSKKTTTSSPGRGKGRSNLNEESEEESESEEQGLDETEKETDSDTKENTESDEEESGINITPKDDESEESEEDTDSDTKENTESDEEKLRINITPNYDESEESEEETDSDTEENTESDEEKSGINITPNDNEPEELGTNENDEKTDSNIDDEQGIDSTPEKGDSIELGTNEDVIEEKSDLVEESELESKSNNPEDIKKKLIQDMLDKYYGNPRKAKEYKIRYKRFKSHVIDKEFKYVKDGEVLTGKCKTVDRSYREYEEDARFLQLGEYAFRLERLTRAELGDFSLYEIIINEYLHYNSGEERSEEVFKQLVEMLRQEDAEYIETNNYAYNSHRATSENLKTLGKHGERVSYIPLSQEKTSKAKLGNVARVLANIGIVVRNYTTAPIHRAIGSFVIRPVHDLIIDAEKNQDGIYSGHLTHRYLARKVYFESLYLQELERENERRKEKKEPLKKINGLVLAFKPRFKAIINYKDGNKAVLNAGSYDIVTSFDRIEEEQREFESKIIEIKTEISRVLSELNETNERIQQGVSEDYTESILKRDKAIVESLTIKLLKLQDKLNAYRYGHHDIIQTDAISLSSHDMANKENITRVVTGVKTAGRVAAMRFVGPKIKNIIIEQTKKNVPEEITIEIPEQKTVIPAREVQKVVQEPVVVHDVQDIKVGDLLDTSGSEVTYDAAGGSVATVSDNAFLRGISFRRGEISGADANGFDLTFTNAEGELVHRVFAEIIPKEEDSIFELFAQIATKKSGGSVTITAQDIFDEINNATDPYKKFLEYFSDTDLWLSNRATGMPTGWKDISDRVVSLYNDLSHEELVDKVITETIPAKEIITPSAKITRTVLRPVIEEQVREVFNWRYAAIESLLAAGGVSDLNDLLRRTRSKEEVIEEKKIDFPQKEENKENKKFKTTSVPPIQRDNKESLGERHYDYDEFHFEGTKKGDYESDYDESGMETPSDDVVSEEDNYER